jgi:hypothetical protein
MRAIAALIVLLCLAPTMAFAQSIPLIPGSVEISLAGGASVPFGDFNTFVDPGFGATGMATFYVMPTLGVGAEGAYNSYGTSSPDVDVKIVEFGAYGKYLLLPGPVNPYLKAGAGIYSSKVTGLNSTNDMGINGGVGAQIKLPTSKIGFFGEAIAYNVFTEGSSTNYYSIRGGISFFLSPTH